MLTGVFGRGKTVLAHALFNEINKSVYQIAYINNPHLSAVALLRAIARRLGVEKLPEKMTEVSADFFLEVINEILLNNVKDGKETLVIVDEAHVITDNDTLEEIRLVLNFQFENRFLLTLLLMSRPDLKERIRRNKQLAQRDCPRNSG